MTQHIDLRGSSYISTPDVNLLDADTAHLHQSLGQWGALGGSSSVAQSTALTPIIGSFHGSAALPTGFAGIQTDTGTDGYPISPSTQYSVSIKAAASAAQTVKLYVGWYSAAGAQISTSYASATATPLTTAFQTIEETFTSPGTAAFCNVRLAGNVTGESLYWDSALLSAGSDASFVPSQRIVGDLDLRAKIAADDYAGGTSQQIINCLLGNNGYQLSINSTGSVIVGLSNGTSYRWESSAAFSFVDGAASEIRVTADVSAGTLTYFENGSQVDTDPFTAGPIGGALTAPALRVGTSASATETLTGKVYWAEVRDGIDGPVVARFDASTLTEADVVAAEVTQ